MKKLCVILAWLAFLLMLGIVGGCENGWMPLSAMWWAGVLMVIWAAGLWKAGWLRK